MWGGAPPRFSDGEREAARADEVRARAAQCRVIAQMQGLLPMALLALVAEYSATDKNVANATEVRGATHGDV